MKIHGWSGAVSQVKAEHRAHQPTTRVRRPDNLGLAGDLPGTLCEQRQYYILHRMYVGHAPNFRLRHVSECFTDTTSSQSLQCMY